MYNYFGHRSSVFIGLNLHVVGSLSVRSHFNFNCASGDAPDSITLTSDLRFVVNMNRK